MLLKHCTQCGKTFFTQHSLSSHIAQVHPKKLFQCYYCNHVSKKKGHLSNHVKSHFKVRNSTRQFSCGLCCHLASDRRSMLRHYTGEHGISMYPIKLKFKTYDDFVSWKSTLEKTEQCSYVSHGGPKRKAGNTSRFFKCSRDGLFSSKGKGKRRLKVRGSCKMNGICPSRISCVEDHRTGQAEVSYVAAHVGHDRDIGVPTLTKEEKAAIARKIAANVPIQVIKDDLREAGIRDGDQIDRSELLTRKALWNIKRDYHLNIDRNLHANDFLNVASFVNEMKEDSNVIRFFKQQGTRTTHTSLKIDDIVLIFATDTQLEMLAKYGHKCICLDSTHGVDQCDFDLTTLVVLNDEHQAFPVAYLLSNRADPESSFRIISVFAETLKGILGDVRANVIMTDMSDVPYNGWCAVMPTPEHRLYCSWHVDSAWRAHLSDISRVNKKCDVYKMIKTLQFETEESAFQPMLEGALENMMGDPDTANFGAYFKNEFEKPQTLWAFCFRKRVGMNTNMSVLALHKQIKQIYFSGEKAKCLDKALRGLVRLSRDRLFPVVIDSLSGKLTPKLMLTRQRHERAVTMSSNITASDSGFTISSDSGSDTHEVERVNSRCGCAFKCADCAICIHEFSCTCIDYLVRYNMCHHIHKVQMFLEDQELLTDDAMGLEIVLSTSDSQEPVEHDWRDHGTRGTRTDLDAAKDELMEEFERILRAVKCPAHLDVVRQNILPIMPMIEAVNDDLRNKRSKTVNPCANVTPEKTNKNSVNKKRKPNNNAAKKPTDEERNSICSEITSE